MKSIKRIMVCLLLILLAVPPVDALPSEIRNLFSKNILYFNKDQCQPPSGFSGDNNRQIAFNFFVSKGLTAEQSAGIVGNLLRESAGTLDPKIVQGGGGPGRGIAQWTVDGRWQSLLKWASEAGKDPLTFETQLEYVWYELETFPQFRLAELRTITDIVAATIHVETYYEISADDIGSQGMNQRIKYAQEVYDAFASSASSFSTGNISRKVYMIGDSIGEGVKAAGIEASFVSQGWEPLLSVSQGRGISPDGLATLDSDQQFIRSANAIVVELGTNPGGSFPNLQEQMIQFITKIKSLNQNAKIYWVNIASKVADQSARNSTISSLATQLGYTVIDWAATNPPLAGDNIHSTPEGYKSLANMIVNAVTASTAAEGCNRGSKVNTEGYAFPLEGTKADGIHAYTNLPCTAGPAGCHHDGTPAFDLVWRPESATEGKKVFAIHDGVIQHITSNFKGVSNCFAIQLQQTNSKNPEDDGWVYGYLHVTSPLVSENQQVKAGEPIASVGNVQCAENTIPHLHIDRGSPKGHRGGSPKARDAGIIDIINSLYEELP